jgi:hypothetical protein
MTENRRALALNVLLGFIIAAAVVAIEYSYGYTLLRLLSDGFFTSTVLLLGMGGLTAARNAGMFDIMGFSVRSIVGIVIPGSRIGDPHDGETLLEYKERKAENRKSPKSMLLAGLVHAAIMVVVLTIYLLTE